MILAGDLPPGTFLPPRKDLAAQFNVGLSTIHEAIKALTTMGLLESRSGKGTWVLPEARDRLVRLDIVGNRLSELGAIEIYEARMVIEVALVDFAAQRATSGEIEEIFQAVRSMKATQNDESAYVESDLSFHFAVARAAHNTVLEQFYHLVQNLLSDILVELNKLPKAIEDGIAQQEAIALAILDHNPTIAKQLTCDLLKDFLNRIETIPGTRFRQG
ncbi:MAG: FadR family transcriptional regulator [Anaerolineales bacterium]|nr:FadR family transcriptional regulator [Anaerolineales bacterium]